MTTLALLRKEKSFIPVRFKRQCSYLGLFLLLKGLGWMTRCLPWHFSVRWVGGGIGLLSFFLSKRYRTRSLEHFQVAFGAYFSKERAYQIVQKSFKNLGKSLIETLNLPSLIPRQMDALVEWEGEEHLKTMNGQGILLITGHLGNWELMGAALAVKGYRLHAVVAPLDDPRLNLFVMNLRTRFNVGTILRGTSSSSRRALEILKEKKMLALLVDQDIQGNGVFVPFFNKKAYTQMGAARLALRPNVGTVLAFIVRLPSNRHRIIIEKPVQLSRTGRRRQDIEINTAFFTARIEQYVRQYPDQWVWMHRRWKTEVESRKGACIYPTS